MQFSCDQCGATYRIDDGKLAGRARSVFACKHCGKQIELSAPAPGGWFVRVAGQSVGPVTGERLQAMAASGELGPLTHVWREGMGAWLHAEEVAELAPVLGPRNGTAGPRPPLQALVGSPSAPPGAKALAQWAGSEAHGNVPSQAPARAAPPVDPFSLVPDSPFMPPPGEVTASIIRRSGLHRSRSRMVAGLVGAALALGVAAFLLFGPDEARAPAKDAAAPRAQAPVAAPTPAPGEGAPAAASREASPAAARPAVKSAKKAPNLSARQKEELAALYADTSKKDHELALPAAQSQTVDTVAASLDNDVVAKVIGEHMAALQACIDAERRRQPDFKGGKVRITVTVRPSGTVGAASVDDRAVDASALGQCFKDRAKRMVFPAFAGEPFDVEIPLVLGSGY